MNTLTRIFKLLLIILISCFTAGCITGTSQQSVYYVFTASQTTPLLSLKNFNHNIGIGPVKIPEYLQRPQIVRQKSANTLEINEFHRWGDSLEAQITSVLAQNLSTLLDTPGISTYPWKKPLSPTIQISIDFSHFHGSPAGSAKVEAIWRIINTKNDTILLTKKTSLLEPGENSGHEALVKALNMALDKLSREIASAVVDKTQT